MFGIEEAFNQLHKRIDKMREYVVQFSLLVGKDVKELRDQLAELQNRVSQLEER